MVALFLFVSRVWPSMSAAARMSAVSGAALGLDGSTRNPKVEAVGTSSLSRPNRFDPSAL